MQGSVEVLSDLLAKLSNDKVRLKLLRSGVGAITETDVLLASASNAIIIGFNVRPERKAQELAEQEKVDIRLHSIIYELQDEIKRAMSGLLEPTIKETYQGRAEVLETFRIPKVGTIAGCRVSDGLIKRDSEVRLLRDNVVVFKGKVGSLRRFKDDASQVTNGMECGISISNYGDIKVGDVIEAFVTERIAAEGSLSIHHVRTVARVGRLRESWEEGGLRKPVVLAAWTRPCDFSTRQRGSTLLLSSAHMRAAAILGLGCSAKDLKPFQTNETIDWRIGLPSAADQADVILLFGGDGTIHRHLSQLVKLGCRCWLFLREAATTLPALWGCAALAIRSPPGGASALDKITCAPLIWESSVRWKSRAKPLRLTIRAGPHYTSLLATRYSVLGSISAAWLGLGWIAKWLAGPTHCHAGCADTGVTR